MAYELEQQQLADRLRRAQLMQQAQGPQGQMVSGHYVAPNALQYLASGLRQYVGNAEETAVRGEQKKLVEGQQQKIAEALRNFNTMAQGTPENAPGDGVGPTMPAQPANMRGAYAALMEAPDQQLRQAGLQGMTQLPEMEARAADRTENREFRKAEADAARTARVQQLELAHEQRMENMKAQNASREQMAAEQREFQREMAKMRQSMAGAAAQPYFQPVQTAQGVMAFNARTGRVEPVMGPAGAPIIGAGADPALQGALAGAKASATSGVEQGVERGKAVKKSEQMLSALDQAETLLKAGPTQSGIGSAADAAARFAGISTPGAQTAGQLETLSGWLVANVPRMEGPQSNIDVQNYTTMAGMVGDRTRPVAERMAALKTVRELQQKYKQFNQDQMGSAPSQAAPQKRLRFDAQGNVIP